MVHRFVSRGYRPLFAFVTAVALASTPLLAQAQTPPPPTAAPATDAKAGALGGPRKQLATIIFAGLGGAVLGLSTLSFYGRPQDKLSNIAIGFAFGVIAGTSYVTYKAATNPSELYGRKPLIERELENASRGKAPEVTPLGIDLAFEF